MFLALQRGLAILPSSIARVARSGTESEEGENAPLEGHSDWLTEIPDMQKRSGFRVTLPLRYDRVNITPEQLEMERIEDQEAIDNGVL